MIQKLYICCLQAGLHDFSGWKRSHDSSIIIVSQGLNLCYIAEVGHTSVIQKHDGIGGFMCMEHIVK